LKVEAAAFGARVATNAWQDLVFRNPAGIQYSQGGSAFEGKAGLIRAWADGASELALLQGRRIAHRGVELAVAGDAAVSARIGGDGAVAGRFSAQAGAMLRITFAQPSPGRTFYIDGERQAAGANALRLPRGNHTWEVTSGDPQPVAPAVIRTENAPGSVIVHFSTAAGAGVYRIQVSRDNGRTWSDAGQSAQSPLRLSGLPNGQKLHVRVIAANRTRTSEPGPEYPVYVSDQPPAHPDGLKLKLASGRVDLAWGQVLGVTEYRLYRKLRREGSFECIYRGADRKFADRVPGVIPAFEEPGLAAAAARPPAAYPIYEYAVSAVNGAGEGKKSALVNTDPASWVNWDPRPGEPFRRRYTYNTIDYSNIGREENTNRYYPAQEAKH
jgi:hypothetical protein